MRKINPRINGKQYTQISKPAARKLFIEGKEIFLNPSNLMPGGPWVNLCPIKAQEQYSDLKEKEFTNTVNSFEYYNCTRETGRYANFYTVKE